ncbi:MAG: hypothetical protein NT067_04830 [Candidatus Diapherotrites archaeon]|nr:hypothetical protein [Candidatus Diapherotrites archaeon]
MALSEWSEEKGFFAKNKPKREEGSNPDSEWEKLEQTLLRRKDQANSMDEPDGALIALINQLDSELKEKKQGKADEKALERSKDTLAMIDERLHGTDWPVRELQNKVRKAAAGESREAMPAARKAPEETKMAANFDVKKEEEKIRKAMEAKLREAGQAQKEDMFEEAEPEDLEAGGSAEPAQGKAAVVEDDLFEPEESRSGAPEPLDEAAEESFEEEFEETEKPAKAEKKAAEQPSKKEKKEVSRDSFKGTVDLEKAEFLYKASVNQLLKAQLENGAIIPTSSEKSYLHIYPRDLAFCTLALVKAERFDEAQKALDFALRHQDRKTGCFPQRWDEAGNNNGYKPVQPDATALVLYAFAEYVLEKNNVDFAEVNWDRIEKAIDFLNSKIVSDKNLVFAPSSVHEFPPMEEGYEIWANAVCCAAFRELSKVAEKIKAEYLPLSKENALKDSMLQYLWNSRKQCFVKTIRLSESSSVMLWPDASVLALSFFDVFAPNDKKIVSTIKLLDEKLWHKSFGGISKFGPVEGVEKGGFGASPFFSLLLADYYIKAGDREKAEKFLNWVISVGQAGSLPEHVSTKEDFEAFVLDFGDAGLLNRNTMKQINSVRESGDFKNGIARITDPFSMAHAAFILVWKNYKEKFMK